MNSKTDILRKLDRLQKDAHMRYKVVSTELMSDITVYYVWDSQDKINIHDVYNDNLLEGFDNVYTRAMELNTEYNSYIQQILEL